MLMKGVRSVEFFMLVFSAILLALSFAVNKSYQKTAGSSMEIGLIFNILTGLFTALVFYIIGGFRLQLTVYSVLMASAQSILCVAYTIIGFQIMSKGKIALYTVFLMTGGMVVPFIWGLLFLNEPFTPLRTMGLIVIAISVIATNADSQKLNVRQIVMCCAVFLLNGFVSVISKEHQIHANAVSSLDFVILSSLTKLILCAAALLFVKRTPERKKSLTIKLIPLILVSALLSGGSYLLQLTAAVHLPASVLYPTVTGGSILFTAAAGRLFYKEKLTPKLLCGVILCFLGTCMFL